MSISLTGRESECVRLDALLDAAREGTSAALVLRGEAGAGKSALLDHAVDRAPDLLVLRGIGLESEAELPFGALHSMLYPHLDLLEAIPEPQAAALRGAFGLTGTPVENRFLIGAGTLSLLAALAERQPVLCLVDDAQWLDQGSSEALLFAARRFHADAIAMLFAVRETSVPFATAGIPAL
ncbi:ATP-binding protein, partial [Pseudonocardia pini]|uniref:ATP-binding protein n=1 Tax=Pseudonocardia pini TaxID=2758030 RepID=UPI0028AAC608